MAKARTSVDTQTAPTLALPIIIERRTSTSSIAVACVFIILAAAILLTPFSLLAAGAATDPGSVLTTLQHPAVALQLGLGLVVAVVFVAMPLRNLVRRSRLPSRIVVSTEGVSAGHGADGDAVWREPLSAYRGIAHHIRTSLSGTEHEIVLVHPESAKSVVIESADRIALPRLDAIATLLGVPQVSAQALYQGRAARHTDAIAATTELRAA